MPTSFTSQYHSVSLIVETSAPHLAVLTLAEMAGEA